MTVSTLATSTKNLLNQCNATILADLLRTLGFGNLLRWMPVSLRMAAPAAAAANPYLSATPLSITLPDDAKAAQIISAYARAGTGTKGPLTVSTSQTPAAGSVGISNSGDLILNETDAFTSVDITYTPERQECVEVTVPCIAASGVAAIPAYLTARGVVTLMEAEILVGTLTGAKIVTAPAATAPATTIARLNFAKTSVFFAVADAATSVRLKLGVASATDANAVLEAAASL